MIDNNIFDYIIMEQRPEPKKQESTIVKICKKKEVVDEVFPDVEKMVEPEDFIVDKLDEKKIDRSMVLKRLNKLINGEYVDELVLDKPKEKEPEQEPKEMEEKEQEPKAQKVQKEKKEEEESKEEKETKEKAKRKPRVTKKQKAIQEAIKENMVVFSGELYTDITKPKKQTIQKASTYYMTNRGMFIQKLNGLFKSHAEEMARISDEDVSCEKRATKDFETLTHQKIVRDYINLYSPYRGLLIYHGLGSGKTCTSIAVAEGMKSKKQIVIMTPASLKSNFFSELKKCGDDIYRKNQYWVKTAVVNKTDASKLSKVTALDEEYIMQNGVWLGKKTEGNTGGKKYEDLSPIEQNDVDKQLDMMIRKKYLDINYNGLNMRGLNKLTDNNSKNPFDNCVVIIDEAHNFVSRIVNKINKRESLAYRLYDYLLGAQNAKLIFLTGTPIINYPNEIAILFNMLRGYIKTWTFPVVVKTSQKMDRDAILKFFEKDNFNVYDYVEYSGNKIFITRNPFGFVNVLKKNPKDPFADYSGVTLDDTGNISDIDFKERVISILEQNGLTVERPKIKYDNIKALPDDVDSFINKFIDPETGNLNNEDLFKRRILGLTSYFKSAQEKLLPKYDSNRDFQIIRVPMSNHQLLEYSLARKRERTEIKNKKPKADKNLYKETTSTYRIFSRELCNFVFPTEYPRPSTKLKEADPTKQEDFVDESEIDSSFEFDYAEELNKALTFLKENSNKYLTKEGLENLSPKFLHMLEQLDDEENEGLHLVYSQFRTIEGIGVLKLILEQNGYAEFKLTRVSGEWDIQPQNPEDEGKPRFVLYTGTETEEEKEIIRNVYNSNWSQLSSTIRNKLEKIHENNYMGEIIKIFMITSSGAEGINLENTRFVHISEPYWHPVRIEQVIGRARRICSHKNLPEHLRNIKVFLYLSTISQEQLEKNIELKTLDDGKTTDEYLYEIANTKERINKQILNAAKETAMDCSLYKGSGELVCYTFGRVTNNDFATVPILEQDTMQNVVKPKIKLKGVEMNILGKSYISVQTKDKNVKLLYDIEPPNNFVGNAINEGGEWRIE
jgi:hypothetical protein